MNKAVHPQQARPALRLLCILTPTPYGQWRPVPAATHRPRAPRADIRGRWGYVLPEELYMREVWIRTPRVSWRRFVAQHGAFGAEVS